MISCRTYTRWSTPFLGCLHMHANRWARGDLPSLDSVGLKILLGEAVGSLCNIVSFALVGMLSSSWALAWFNSLYCRPVVDRPSTVHSRVHLQSVPTNKRQRVSKKGNTLGAKKSRTEQSSSPNAKMTTLGSVSRRREWECSALRTVETR